MPQREDERAAREDAEDVEEEGEEDADDGCDDVQELLARDDAVIECVPNISEGRDAQVVEAVAAAARGVAGCTLLDVSSGADTHRSVLTLAGAPAAVVAAARALAAAAATRIDMRRHAGAHPRLGALDVCPLVPVRGLSLRQCAVLARELARLIAEDLDVPVYLYGAAVQPGPERDYRRTAPQIRAGEYEGLAKKLEDPRWAPDFGPAAARPRFGACLVGARPFLLAFNVNVLGTKEQAHRIALNLRSAGRGPQQPGRLRAVQGMGWWLAEHNMAQVSLNLSALEQTPLHVALEAVREEAAALRVGVAGAEVVGLVPLRALTLAARFYARKEGLLLLETHDQLALAVARLGLNQLAPFDPRERVLELRLGLHEAPGPLAAAPLRDFIRDVGARSASPGGGAASAIAAALGAALGRMVAQLTYGKRAFERVDAAVRRVLPPLHAAARRLEGAADRDARAFQRYLDALRLPAGEARAAAEQRALTASAEAPLGVLRELRGAGALWGALRELAGVCNPAAACDLRVAAQLLPAGARGCAHNVDANAALLRDAGAARRAREEAWRLAEEAAKKAQELLRILDERAETRVEPL